MDRVKRIIAELDAQISSLQRARNALAGLGSRGRSATRGPRRGTRVTSSAAKARIAAAQRARWAKWRKSKGKAP